MRWPVRALQQLRAATHSVCGWVLFRAGLRLRARTHFERVLELRGDDFSAYVHLGRIAFATGDYSGWRRDFEHARRADPARFARLRHAFEPWQPRLAGTQCVDPLGQDGMTFEGSARSGEPASWSALFGAGPARASAPRADGGEAATTPPGAAFGAGSAPDSPAAPGHPDDFCTAAERRRFHDLGPIRPDDIQACDLDDLARRLSG
jgi:hypothetical protein